MPKPSKFDDLVNSVTRDVVAHPRDLTRQYAERLSISRVAANRYIRKLESEGWIARSGPSTHPVFSPGYRRRVTQLYSVEGLEEHVAWERDFKPYFQLSSNVLSIANHGFTEMLNNAIDHSGGESVFVWMNQTANATPFELILRSQQIDSLSLRTCTACTAYTMDVILWTLRQIIIDHALDVRNV